MAHVTEIHRFAAMTVERELREITDRFQTVSTHNVLAIREGFKITFEIGRKDILDLNNEFVELVIPYDQFDEVVDSGLRPAELVRKYAPEHAKAIDTAMFGKT